MIEELTTYISEIQKQFPLHNFIKEPQNGFRIMFEVRNSEVEVYDKELYLSRKRKEGNISDFLLKECMPREMNIDFIDSWKAIRGKRGSRIRSVSPFAIKIYKSEISDNWKKWIPQNTDLNLKTRIKEVLEDEKKIKQLKKDEKWDRQLSILKEKIRLLESFLKPYVQQYFKGTNEVCKISNIDDLRNFHVIEIFQKFISEHLVSILIDTSEDIAQLNSDDFIILLLKNADVEQYQIAYSKYLEEYVFNTTAIPVSKIGHDIYGLSNYKNVASDKKPYLQHLTAPFGVNNRIKIQHALLLNIFDRYVRAKALKTNPLPIFIDYAELNNSIINIIKEEGNDVRYSTIIKKLFNDKVKDLGNYYLLYFMFGELKDMDFVSNFNYKLKAKIKHVVPNEQPERDVEILNVFDFEQKIIQPIFSNKLIQRRKENKIAYRYFDEIDNNPKYITATQWNIVMKYRKAFYDWIYKSRKQAVSSSVFHDILMKGIIDDIRNDEFKIDANTGKSKHTKQYDIIAKLNIWFSLWDFFGNDKQQNNLTMANKIQDLQKRLRSIRENNGEEHIQNDEEFAYTVGQIIYFLLSKSKSANKTHALLEPFIQKTDEKELKKVIINTFNAYKHEIDFGKGRFEKLLGEVLSYEIERNFKDLIPFVLAGYFSNSVIYETSNN